MYPYFRIGPYLIQLSGLALLAGMWFGITLIDKEATRLKLNASKVANILFYGLIAGILGARLGYALQFSDVYISNPLSLFSLNTNTLSPGAGLVIGLIVATIYGQRNRLGLRSTLDALTPGLALFMVTFGIAHILNGNAYGAPTQLPWSIFLWADYRHPSQIYETIAAVGILFLVLRKPLNNPEAGLNFWFFTGISAVAYIFLEAFRGDSLIWGQGFRAAQLIGLAVLATSVFFIWQWSITGKEDVKQRRQ
jgi:phosphatidylglycerol---prolipoprotein diacylglyceryl transferase